MIRFYLKLAIRRLFGNNHVSLINIIGLGVTFTVFILLGTYVNYERNIGKNIPNFHHIYRVQPEEGYLLSYNKFKLLDDIPGIQQKTRVMESWSLRQHFTIDGKNYQPDKLMYVDENFFNVFPYSVIFGNIRTAFENPNSLAITKRLALQLFGNEQVVGEFIQFNTSAFGNAEYEITAVLEDLPPNDLFGFTCVMPIQSLYRVDGFKKNQEHWGSSNYNVFALIKDNVPIEDVERAYNDNFQKQAPDWVKEDDKYLHFTSFASLYTMDSVDEYVIKKGEQRNIKTLFVLMVVILLAGTLNHINLNTAKKVKNGKILAIENVNGASSPAVYTQFIIDALLVATISLLLSMVLLAVLYPVFNQLSGKTFSYPQFIRFFYAQGNWIIPYVLTLLGGMIISLYFQSNRLKLIAHTGYKAKETLRNGLLIIQFILSIMLIAGTIMIHKQNQYMLNSPSKFKQESVVCIPMIGDLEDHTKAIYIEFNNMPEIDQITFASDIMGQEFTSWGTSLLNEGIDKRVGYDVIQVDSAFFRFMDFKILEGHGFNASSIKEMHHILNETAKKEFGINDINQARITSFDNASGDVIGVVNDFNYRSLHSRIWSMCFILRRPENLSYMYLKTIDVKHQTLSKVLKKANSIWNQYASEWPFEYYFLDQQIEKQYDKDKAFSRVAFVVTLLTIIVACIGLLGITFYLLESKIKEIGIRKVNGAKISEIMALLNKDFIKWVVISFVIACPIAYYVMQKWLENFAYKTNVSWWIFALAGLLALGIALLTVSWQSWRAAIRNPVESLRYE